MGFLSKTLGTSDPEVEVAGAYGEVVGRLVIGRLEPGAKIPVRVDPKDAGRVTGDEPAMLGQTP